MRTALCLVILVMLAGCSDHKDVLKSPCAGTEGSPCGPKRSVNDWWLHPAVGHATKQQKEIG